MVLEGILSLCNRKNVIFVILCAAVIYVHLVLARSDETKCRSGGRGSRCREDEALRFLIAL